MSLKVNVFGRAGTSHKYRFMICLKSTFQKRVITKLYTKLDCEKNAIPPIWYAQTGISVCVYVRPSSFNYWVL